jgi:glutamate dehydrogenase
LRGEIIAMQLANEMVNFGGANFAHRMMDETGVDFSEVATCFTLAKEVFGIDKLFEAIEALDNKVSAKVQIDMMFEAQRMLRRCARWFMRQRRKDAGLADEIARFKPAIDTLLANLTQFLDPSEANELLTEAEKLIKHNVPKKLAQHVSFLSTVFAGLDIAEVAEETGKPIELVAETYFRLGVRTDLHWFLSQIVKQPVDNHWQAFARAAFREELDWQQRQLTVAVLKLTDGHADATMRIDAWIDANNDSLKRWLQLLTDFRASQVHEFAKFSVALRELGILVQTSLRQKAIPKPKRSIEKAAPAKTKVSKKAVKVSPKKSAKTAVAKKPVKSNSTKKAK